MPQRLVEKIDSWWKVGGILGGCIAIGVSGGFMLGNLASLPGSVEANEAAITSNTARIETLEDQMVASKGDLNGFKESLTERLDRVECLVIAGRRNTPIEDCL